MQAERDYELSCLSLQQLLDKMQAEKDYELNCLTLQQLHRQRRLLNISNCLDSKSENNLLIIGGKGR